MLAEVDGVVGPPRGIEVDEHRNAAAARALRIAGVLRADRAVALELGLAVLRGDDLYVARRRRRAHALEERIEQRKPARVRPKVWNRVAVDVRHGFVAHRGRLREVAHAERRARFRRHRLRPLRLGGDEPIHRAAVHGRVHERARVVQQPQVGRRNAKRLRLALRDRVELAKPVRLRLRG